MVNENSHFLLFPPSSDAITTMTCYSKITKVEFINLMIPGEHTLYYEEGKEEEEVLQQADQWPTSPCIKFP